VKGHPGLRVKIKAVVMAARNKIRRPVESQKVWLTFSSGRREGLQHGGCPLLIGRDHLWQALSLT